MDEGSLVLLDFFLAATADEDGCQDNGECETKSSQHENFLFGDVQRRQRGPSRAVTTTAIIAQSDYCGTEAERLSRMPDKRLYVVV